MKILTRLMFRRKFLVFVSICFGILIAVLILIWNDRLSVIINAVSQGVPPSGGLLTGAVAVMFLLGGFTYAKNIISGFTCESMTHDLRMGYARRLSAIPVAEVEKLNAGEELSKLQNEIAGVSNYLNNNLFQLFEDCLRFILTFVWLLTINPVLTITSNIPVILLMIYVFWSSKIIGKATSLSQQAKGNMNQYNDTLLTLFPIIRLYDAARLTSGGYASAVKVWETNTCLAERTRARLMSLSAIISILPLALLLFIGGRMVISGALSVGELYIYINLSGNVSGVLMNMPAFISAFRQFAANMGRLEGKICL